MLTVKLNNGNEDDRTFYVNDVQDLKRVMDNILDDFQKCLENEMNEDKIALQRIFDNSDYDNEDDLIEWIEKMKGLESDLRNSDFDDIDEMVDRIDNLECAIDDIFHSADDVRRW